jgi:hypothetical protein
MATKKYQSLVEAQPDSHKVQHLDWKRPTREAHPGNATYSLSIIDHHLTFGITQNRIHGNGR